MNKYIQEFEKRCKDVYATDDKNFQKRRENRVWAIYRFLVSCGEDKEILERILEENDL